MFCINTYTKPPFIGLFAPLQFQFCQILNYIFVKFSVFYAKYFSILSKFVLYFSIISSQFSSFDIFCFFVVWTNCHFPLYYFLSLAVSPKIISWVLKAYPSPFILTYGLAWTDTLKHCTNVYIFTNHWSGFTPAVKFDLQYLCLRVVDYPTESNI